MADILIMQKEEKECFVTICDDCAERICKRLERSPTLPLRTAYLRYVQISSLTVPLEGDSHSLALSLPPSLPPSLGAFLISILGAPCLTNAHFARSICRSCCNSHACGDGCCSAVKGSGDSGRYVESAPSSQSTVASGWKKWIKPGVVVGCMFFNFMVCWCCGSLRLLLLSRAQTLYPKP